MISRFFPANQNVQRVVHYQGRRPLRALFFIFLGYLIGWYACARDSIGRLTDHPIRLTPPAAAPR